MSPLLAPFARHPSSNSRDDSNHLTRFRQVFLNFANARKHDRPILQSIKREKSFDDLQHCNTHSTLHSYMSTFKTKIRRMNSAPPGPDAKGMFSFRALDGRRSRFLRSPVNEDRFILSNSQTIANDSTDQKLIRM